MGRFVADPDTLILKGNEMEENGNAFMDDINKVYTTLDDMINKDYLSPEALVIAKKMESQRKDLEDMAKTMNQYGDFSKRAGNKVLQNQENISAEIQ